ncbi:MAG: hypothetical protein QNJ44_00935 [Rhodobacter sp.]|nr:hypothetical protein [Rhodobacter sp.]
MMRLVAMADPAAACRKLAGGLACRLDLDFHGAEFRVAATSETALARLARVNHYFRGGGVDGAQVMVLAEAGTRGWSQAADLLGAPQLDPTAHLLMASWFPHALQIRDATLLHYYSSKLLRLAVAAEHRDKIVTLHAASLEAPNGRGLLMVGEAASGKTSTTLDLIEHGFRFLSDDTSCIRRNDLSCLPFPTAFIIRGDLQTGEPMLAGLAGKPPDIALLDEPRWLWERWDAVGRTVAPSVLLFFGTPGLAPGEVRPIPASDAALRLMGNIVVPLGADPETAVGDFTDLDTMCSLAERATCYEANAQDRAKLIGWIADQMAPPFSKSQEVRR